MQVFRKFLDFRKCCPVQMNIEKYMFTGNFWAFQEIVATITGISVWEPLELFGLNIKFVDQCKWGSSLCRLLSGFGSVKIWFIKFSLVKFLILIMERQLGCRIQSYQNILKFGWFKFQSCSPGNLFCTDKGCIDQGFNKFSMQFFSLRFETWILQNQSRGFLENLELNLPMTILI